jgi:hypothetical protein
MTTTTNYLTKCPNRANTCQVCNAEYLVTVIAYEPIRVLVSCACNAQILDAKEAKAILQEVATEDSILKTFYFVLYKQ